MAAAATPAGQSLRFVSVSLGSVVGLDALSRLFGDLQGCQDRGFLPGLLEALGNHTTGSPGGFGGECRRQPARARRTGVSESTLTARTSLIANVQGHGPAFAQPRQELLASPASAGSGSALLRSLSHSPPGGSVPTRGGRLRSCRLGGFPPCARPRRRRR
jgi:hypothetical protein